MAPYDLLGLNYYEQRWFGEVVRKGIYISDVYFGYRQLPHFIIAVVRQENQNTWILRATIDPDVLKPIKLEELFPKVAQAFEKKDVHNQKIRSAKIQHSLRYW